jgi:hypothetical protein
MARLVIRVSGVLKSSNLSVAAVVEFKEATNGLQSECLLNAARRLVPIRPTAPKANREGPFDEHESLGPGRNPVVDGNSVVKAYPPPNPKHTSDWSLKHDKVTKTKYTGKSKESMPNVTEVPMQEPETVKENGVA